MTNEIQVGSAILSPTETLFATLAAWHPFVDVYVDGSAEHVVPGSQWNVYAVTSGTRTRIASGKFDAQNPLEGQRVVAKVPGLGTSIELWAFSPDGTSLAPVRAAIVGWDPSTATVNPSDADDTTLSLVPGAEVDVAAIVWHPEVSAFVEAPARALGSFWRIRAVIAGFVSDVPVTSGTFQDVQASRIVCQTEGGATSWKLTASAPAGATGPVNASLFGKTEFDLGTIGGVINVTATLPVTSSGGVNPNIAINPVTVLAPGSMSAADKVKLDALGVIDVGGILPISVSAGVHPVVSISAASHDSAGSMSAADKNKLDGLPASAVPTTRTLTAGAGMTGGGDLSADRTFNVVANADGSIAVHADDVQVGVLATDAQHGNRGGGGIHALVVAAGAAGFMSGADKTKLDGLPGPDTDAVIFDDAVPANKSNVRGDQTAHAAIDNTKAGVTSFGSNSGAVASTGVRGNYASCIGGDCATIEGDYASGGGFNPVALRKGSTAFGYAASARGEGCFAGGESTIAGRSPGDPGGEAKFATCFGASSSATGANSVSLGGNNAATGDNTTCIGLNCTATVSGAVALGVGSNATNNQAFAAGGGQASGVDSFAFASSTASGDYSFATGQSCSATNSYAFSQGLLCQATEILARATGRYSVANRVAQTAHSGGLFTNPGDSQACMYLVHSESVNGAAVPLLDLTGNDLQLENGHEYALRATAILGRTDAPGRSMFINDLLVHQTAGVAVIDNNNPTLVVLNGNLWTLVYTAATNRIVCTLTGTAGQTVRGVVKYEWVELGIAP